MGKTSASSQCSCGCWPAEDRSSRGRLYRDPAHRDEMRRRSFFAISVRRRSSGSRKAQPPPPGRASPIIAGGPTRPGDAWASRVLSRQSAAAARSAPRPPELVPDEPAAAARQDGRPLHPACAVLHPATRRKLLDTASVWADRRAHRATRAAPHIIARTVRAGSRLGAGRGVATEGGQFSEEARSAVLVPGKRAVSHAASGQHGSEGVTSPTRQCETRKKMGPNRQSRRIGLSPHASSSIDLGEEDN